MTGSSITSNKPFLASTGTDPEYSTEDWLSNVTANLIINIGIEPKSWILERTALIKTTFDGAAQKVFPVFPIEIKSNWKRFSQKCLTQKVINPGFSKPIWAHMRPWKTNWKLARPKQFHASCLRPARYLS